MIYALDQNAPAAVTYADLKYYFKNLGMAEPCLSQVRDAVLSIRLGKGMSACHWVATVLLYACPQRQPRCEEKQIFQMGSHLTGGAASSGSE